VGFRWRPTDHRTADPGQLPAFGSFARLNSKPENLYEVLTGKASQLRNQEALLNSGMMGQLASLLPAIPAPSPYRLS